MNRKALVSVAVMLVLPQLSFAQEAPPQQADDHASATNSERVWKFSWDNRPSLRYGDLLRIDFRARLTGDLRRSEASLRDTDTSRFDIARRRIGVSGEIGGVADFQVERELAHARPWRDVYVDYHRFNGVRIQAGQFKLPFGLDENTSSANLDFVYRSRAAELSPGRDPGVMVHGRAGVLRYEAGMFAHDGDNARGNDTVRVSGGRTAAGRLLVQPFRSSTSLLLKDLQAGIAYTSSRVSAGIADLRVDTALGQPFFRPGLAVQGTRSRAGVEMRWRPGPFSVQSEFVRLTSERRGQSIDETDLPPLRADAWYAQGGWVVTGERKAKGGADEPRRPLFRGGAGAVELAARIEAVRLSSSGPGLPSTGPRAEAILPYRDRVLTLGVNWSPNRWVRVQANLVRDRLSMPTAGDFAGGALPERAASSFWSRVVRFRFAM